MKLILALLAMFSLDAFGACLRANSCVGTLTFSDKRKLTYYRTHPLGTKDSSIKMAIILIHGSERNAAEYYNYLAPYINKLGIFATAPLFSDTDKTGYHVWKTTGWRKGDNSNNGMSSFQIIDEILDKIKFSYSAVNNIVLIGHSAGGQFVNRYIAGGNPKNIPMTYIVMNPSSYLYIDKRRPNDVSSCLYYNFYHYGLDVPNEYMKGKDVFKNYTSRKMIMLVGSQDTSVDSGLDVSCSANAQGKNRLERARNYESYIESFPAWHKNITYGEIPAVGHSGSKMINAAIKFMY